MAKFTKGQSGNPGGRSKATTEIAHLARAHGPRAIERLAEILESEDEGHASKAAEILLARGHGAPKQVVEVREAESLTDAELLARAALALRAGDPDRTAGEGEPH